jgi:1,2-diacylglycerol 3-alpha-glucosyltransferase
LKNANLLAAFSTLERQNILSVMIASSGLGHVARGIEAWANDLGGALAARGEAVTLCKGAGEEEAAYERVVSCWRRDGAETKRLLQCLPRRGIWRLGLSTGYGVEQTTFALALLKHLRNDRIKLLHVQDPQVAAIVQRAARLGWVRTKVILAHGTEEAPHSLRRFDYLQHLAPWHLEEGRLAGSWKPTWTAIPNFIDTDRFRPGRAESLRTELGIPHDARVVLSVAAIKRHHKRVDHLIEEFVRLREERPDSPAWLVVAGGWESDTDELVDRGRAILGDRVRFLVRFPRAKMPELYRMANAFVLCSLKEMMPIALLEASASGLPCLVNRHPVMEWMVGSGGEAIDMEARGTLAGALGNLLGDEGRRRTLSNLAREHCVENFGQDRVVDQILKYYRFVLSHDRPRSGRMSSNAVVESSR